MPVGPNGEKRPRSVTANAVHVCKVAVGEAEEEYVDGPPKKRVRKVVTRAKSLPADPYPVAQSR